MSTNINFNKHLGITRLNGITLPSTSSFSNVNSFEFDGIDEKMFSTANYTELNGSTNFSISFWIKPIGTNQNGVWEIETQGNNERLTCQYLGSQQLIIIQFRSQSYYYRSDVNSVLPNQWSHIVYTYNAALGRYSRPEIYVNGVLSQGVNSGVPYTISNFNGTLTFGDTTQHTHGNNYIDEFAVWNSTTLTQTQANELYNGGTPSDLNNIASGLAQPTTWFRMGENAAWDGSIWTMTDVNGGYISNSVNMQESSRTTDVPTIPFSTKSIALDGVDDYVNCGDNDNLSFGNGTTDSPFSVSAWVKMDNIANFRAVGKYGASNIEYVLATGGDSKLIFNCYDNSEGSRIGRRYFTPMNSYQGQWIHIVGTYNGNSSSSGLKIYLNGVRIDDTNSNSGTYVAMENTIQPLYIGKVKTSYADGNIDEVSVFNSELSASDITSIYNSGEPNDISSLSPLSWWRCGDNDTSPTLTDNGSGGNNGTMTNFTTFSTDVPT